MLISIPKSVNKSLLIGNKLKQLKFLWHKTLSGSQQGEIDSTQKFGDKQVESQWSGNRSEGEDMENNKLRSTCCTAVANLEHKCNMALSRQKKG